ncbi:carbohydrate sulfotransferase 10-like [Haemaphysalis longicornis]
MCKKYAGLQCNDTTGQNTRRDYLHCGRGQPSFYLVRNRRFGFCSIPKTASSSLKALILKAEHFKDPGDDADQIFFKFQKWFKPVLPSTVWENKLGSAYIKLLVVRHPFERLVSAYVDKVRTTRPFLPSVKQMYKNGFVGKGPNGTFTFGEFVNYILELPADKWDNHWAPFTPRCRPCSMRYNVIARVETLDRDLEAFLPRIGLSGWSLPKRNVKAQKNGSLTREIPQYFSEVSRQQMLRLHAIYMYDFELFGYRLEGYTDPVL